METTALPRFNTSSPFFFTDSITQIADISTVANLVVAKCRSTITKGQYDGNGASRDLHSCDLLMHPLFFNCLNWYPISDLT